ncbi:MAG: PAS domain S-box protein [Chloroflexaceae bacterium]
MKHDSHTYFTYLYLESSRTAMTTSDLEGRYLLVNPMVQQVLGRTDITGKTDYDLFPPELAATIQKHDEYIFQNDSAVEVEDVVQQQGEQRIYHNVKFPLHTVHGEVYALGAVAFDITERTQQEAQLRLFKALIENAPDGFVVADLTGTLTYVNPAYAAAIGGGRDLLGHPLLLGLAEDPDYVATLIQDVIREGAWQGELTFRRSDERTFPGQFSAFLLHDSADHPYSIVGTVRDMTEHKQAEAERAALQQRIIDAQRNTLRELSSPLIPLTDDVVILPLIGRVDSGRAQQIMETLLEGVAQYQADLAIIDITGVSVVDTQVAQALIKAAQAVNLIGARVMLTGIQPQIAQTLVHLGIELHNLILRGSLQAGIAEVMTTSGQKHNGSPHRRPATGNAVPNGTARPEHRRGHA